MSKTYLTANLAGSTAPSTGILNNSTEEIIGELNKDLAKLTYEGETTDSLTITVDNVNRTIKGDVNWDSMLGYHSHRAYPGSDGQRNYRKILELTQALNDEIAQAATSRSEVEQLATKTAQMLNVVESELQEVINEEVTRSIKADNDLIDKIIQEVNRAIQSEKDLLDQIQSERESRQRSLSTVELALQSQIDALKLAVDLLEKQLNNETLRAIREENLLNSKIESEKSRAITAENELATIVSQGSAKLQKNLDDIQEQLDKEVTTRQSETAQLEKKLLQEIAKSSVDSSEIESDIASSKTELIRHSQELTDLKRESISHETEISYLQSSVESLTYELENEINDRCSDIESLQDELAWERTRSWETDEELREDIDNNSYRISDLQISLVRLLSKHIEECKTDENFVPLLPNDGSHVELYAQKGDATITVPLSTDPSSTAIVLRTSSGTISLPQDTTLFTDYDAISKLYVDQLVSSLREDILTNAIEFIDGGNAPI